MELPARRILDSHFSILHWACDRGCMEVVECLLETDPDYPLDAKDEDMLTPLDYAFICENDDIARFLVFHLQMRMLVLGSQRGFSIQL